MNERPQATAELLKEGFENADQRLSEVAKKSQTKEEFSKAMAVLQIEAIHILGLLILNSWVLSGKKGTAFAGLEVIEHNLRAHLKSLLEAHEKDELSSEKVSAFEEKDGQI